LEWRGKARVIAYVHLVLTSLVLLLVIFLTVGAGILTAAHLEDPDLASNVDHYYGDDSGETRDAKAFIPIGAVGLWLVVAVCAIIVFVELYAAIKLLKATDLVREYSEAWNHAATWRNITVVFFVFQVGFCLMSGRFLSLAITVLIRGTFLYIVHKFMAELDSRRCPLVVPNMITVVNHNKC